MYIVLARSGGVAGGLCLVWLGVAGGRLVPPSAIMIWVLGDMLKHALLLRRQVGRHVMVHVFEHRVEVGLRFALGALQCLQHRLPLAIGIAD